MLTVTNASEAAAKGIAQTVNEHGLVLLRQLDAGDSSLVLSPYSIISAFGMAFAGAEAETKEELAKALALDDKSHQALRDMDQMWEDAVRKSEKAAVRSEAERPPDPLALAVANRLFIDSRLPVRGNFLAFVEKNYRSEPELLDFFNKTEASRTRINSWVGGQTADKIRDLIPPNGVTRDTGMVLVNAIHFKGPWKEPFNERATESAPFHSQTGMTQLPFMNKKLSAGHQEDPGVTIVTLPYLGGDLHLLLLLPSAESSLAKLLGDLDGQKLTEMSRVPSMEIVLSIPKFKAEPATIALKEQLKKLGISTAFDIPQGSANFDGIAPRKPDDYLFIGNVFHKACFEINEEGTEAAAATAISMMRATSMPTAPPPRVVLDRPFFYAIQHRQTGLCLFTGTFTGK